MSRRYLLILIFLALGCGRNHLEPEPGTLKGRTLTTQDEPLSGVEVLATADDGTVHRATSGPNGLYTLPLPNGTYRIRALIQRDYLGNSYRLPLAPDSSASVEVTDAAGALRSFRWRIGTAPGDTARFGGTLTLYLGDPDRPFAPSDLPEGSVLSLTLTPTDSLIDGSAGEPLSFSRTITATDRPGTFASDWFWAGLPIGRYRTTATVALPDGTMRPVLVSGRWSERGGIGLGTRRHKAPFEDETTLLFPPESFGSGVGGVDLYVLPPAAAALPPLPSDR